MNRKDLTNLATQLGLCGDEECGTCDSLIFCVLESIGEEYLNEEANTTLVNDLVKISKLDKVHKEVN